MIKKSLSLGIVGATGLVGRTFLKVLEEKSIPIEEIELFATKKTAGTKLTYKNIQLEVQDIEKADFDKYDVLLFSAGKEASQKYVPIAVKTGCLVIDNGSFWRMHPEVPLVVPEVNFQDSLNHKGIIANPNCSTIQLVVALKPISDRFGLRKVEISTYQAISGAGQKGIDKLFQEIKTGRVVETLS
ncbi:MAG: aspartate-semialdehyde dehydrogenase, partial [Candidatus Kapaibacteriota bacterium]